MLAQDPAEELARAIAERAGLARTVLLEPPAARSAEARWRASGLAELTGPADGPPAMPDRDLAGRLEALVRVVRGFAGLLAAPPAVGMSVFSERARDLALQRQGRISANGTARLLPCRQDLAPSVSRLRRDPPPPLRGGGAPAAPPPAGELSAKLTEGALNSGDERWGQSWAVANLARPEDLELFEAWIGAPAGEDPWAVLQRAASALAARELAERARLLGIPAAEVGGAPDEQAQARPEAHEGLPIISRGSAAAAPREIGALRVVDLSGLWAGPLCGRLFAEAGAEVIKVESTRRPDGARAGPAAFFERMNGRKRQVALDFASQDGRAALRELIASADVVIEASRPRALLQLGIDAAEVARARPGLVWISLTAYGRTGPWSNAVGFGDDCAAAAGLVARGPAGEPMFVGDAIADPITGLMAAAAGFAALAAGGGALVDVSLRESAAYVAHAPHLDRRAEAA